MYALEFAKQGAQAVGIEGRLENLEKAKFANEVLGYANCNFVQDDIRNLSAQKYGLFDYEDLEPHLASPVNDRLTFVALKSKS